MRSARAASISTAVTSAPVAASCMVLPPGAAHRSITRLPRTSPSSSAGSAAAASCTHQSPSAKPGMVFDAALRRHAAAPRRTARRFADASRPPPSATMSTGASLWCARAIWRAVPAPYCATQRVHSQSGVDRRSRSRPDSAISPCAATLRSTALISGLKCTALASFAASWLAASTAACAGTFRISSSQAPSSRISVGGARLVRRQRLGHELAQHRIQRAHDGAASG